MAIYQSIFRNVSKEKQHWIFHSKDNRYASVLPAKSEFEVGPFDFRRNASVNLLVNGGLFGTSLRYNCLQDTWSLWPLTSDFSLQVEKRLVIVECCLPPILQGEANMVSLLQFYEEVSRPTK